MGNEKILVTGTPGFIGFHTSLRLLEKGYSVVGADSFNSYYPVVLKEARSEILRKNPNFTERRLNLADRKGITKLFDEFKFSAVCHLAAQAGVRYSLTNPHAYEESNLTSFLNILEMVRHRKIRRLVYASSSSVYGGNKKIPFSESDTVDNPISLYAATKKANELMAHCYSHLYGMETVGLRFFTVYGPWGRPDMAMWLFTEAILKGKPIKVFNFGKMRRDFTFIDDIVSGIEASLFNQNLERYEIFNLGNHKSEELMYVISIIEEQLGFKAEKKMLPLQPGDVLESYAEIDRAQKKLGFSPSTSIEKGIPEFISWYKKHSSLVEQISKMKTED